MGRFLIFVCKIPVKLIDSDLQPGYTHFSDKVLCFYCMDLTTKTFYYIF